jgi:hypothetical protein
MTGDDRFLSEYRPAVWTREPDTEDGIRRGWEQWRAARRDWFASAGLDVDDSAAAFKEDRELAEAMALAGFTVPLGGDPA